MNGLSLNHISAEAIGEPTWFMPALVKSSVGSSCGITDDECTYVWPCFSLK